MNPEYLDRLAALERSASAGPWSLLPGGSAAIDTGIHDIDPQDGVVLIALRNAAPDLIALARRGLLADKLAEALRDAREALYLLLNEPADPDDTIAIKQTDFHRSHETELASRATLAEYERLSDA